MKCFLFFLQIYVIVRMTTNEEYLIKKQMCVKDEFGKDELQIVFTVKPTNNPTKYSKYILEIIDSEGRHFMTHSDKYLHEKIIDTDTNTDINITYNQEVNFEQWKNDVWVEVYTNREMYILNETMDGLESILCKIDDLTDELELLKEKRDVFKAFYPTKPTKDTK